MARYLAAAGLLSLPLVAPAVFVAMLERTRLNLEAEAWTFDDLPSFAATATTRQVAA
jgi:hypothetical protein